MAAAAGVAVTYGVVRVLASMSSILVLIGVAFFLALGLEPAASWFVNRKLPRWAAITLVFAIFLALLGAFVGAAIPPLVEQAGDLIHQAPHYIQQVQDHSSAVGKLNDRFHLQQRITDALNGSGGSLLNNVVSAGTAFFGALADVLIVVVLDGVLPDRHAPHPHHPVPAGATHPTSPRHSHRRRGLRQGRVPTFWAMC